MNPWDAPTAKLGAGAVVMQEKKVLLIQMAYGSPKGQWNLPGGNIELGEHISFGVQREVFEETGYKVEIEGVLGFRQRILPNGISDVYFVCRRRLLSESQDESQIDANENSRVRFWPVQEALDSKEVRPIAREAVRSALRENNFLKISNPADLPAGDILFLSDGF